MKMGFSEIAMQPTCTTLVLVLFLPLLHCSSAVPTLPTAPTDLGFLLGSADVAIRSSLIPGAGLGAFAIRRLEVREGEIENVCGVVWCGVVWCGVLCCAVLCCAVLCCVVSVVWCSMVWCGMVWCDMVWYGVV